MRFQRTLRKEVTFDGIGLHTGRYASVTLRPAARDTGIVFIRADRGVAIKADVGTVRDTAFSTTIGLNGTKIATVEHLLAAVAGLGLDNLVIEVDGPEIPILDGSATEIINVILRGGIAKQGKRMPYLRITRPVVLDNNHSEIAAFPYNGRLVTYRIHYNHHMLGEQKISLELNEETFAREIAPARTFGFLKDVEYLKANGFARGGNLDNAIILGDSGILNSSGLRFSDEFVRHKVLDLIGDMSLIGLPIQGHIVANKSGHSTHIKFLQKLLLSRDCWEIASYMEKELQPALACN